MIDTLKKTWEWIVDRWPWGKKQVTVKPPEEIELVPIPPPVFEIIFPQPQPVPQAPPITVLAVDTRLKRMSVLAQRYGRLPFGRRFTTPHPDGSFVQADRQIIGAMYAGVAAGTNEPVVAQANLIVWHQAFLCAVPYP
jgi:hypothetical protein